MKCWIPKSDVIDDKNPMYGSFWISVSSTPTSYKYRDKMCVYDDHPVTGWDLQYRATDSRSRDTTPFDDILK